MELGFELGARQEQKLAITPELRQSLMVLQYSSQELSEYLQQEMEINPLLEYADVNGMKQEKPVETETYPMDWKEYFRSVSGGNRGLDDPVYREDENDYSYEGLQESDRTLFEHLMLQLDISGVPEFERRIAQYIISNIDDNGYLTVTKHDISAALNIDKVRVSQVLKLVQSFDPPGVGARSLRECLLLQLKSRGVLTQSLKTIVLEHLRDIADNHYGLIARKLGCSIAEVQRMCDLIKTLDPKPGRPFAGTNPIGYLIPDVEIEKVDDEYAVNVRENCAPRLTINKVYQEMLGSPKIGEDVTSFLVSRLQSAHRLIKAIEQRRETVRKIVEIVADYQRDFLDKGILHMKPLTLKTVAERAMVHESTVSRAISGKYAQTPRGIFELKFFFDHGVVSTSGKSLSSHGIKQLINDLISREDVLKPLSDSALADALAGKGIDISRRTVAKYREELGIPCSSKRKRF